MANEDQAQKVVDQGTFDTLFGKPSAMAAMPAKEEGVLKPGQFTTRETLSANPYTGRALEPLFDIGGSGVGLADVLGGVGGAALAASDLQDTMVRDAGPFETGLTSVAAGVSVLPVIGGISKPLGKGARAVGKSLDQLFGTNKKPLSELLEEADAVQALDTPFVSEVKANAPGLEEATEIGMADTYKTAKERGHNQTDSIYGIDPLAINADYSPAELRQVKSLTEAKAATLRHNNPELKSAMIEMFTAEPENFAGKVDSLEVAADYLSEWSVKQNMAGDQVLNMTELMGTPNKMEYAQNAVLDAHARGDVTMEDAQNFLDNYANVVDNEAALFHTTNVGIYSKLGDQYSGHIKAAKTLQLEGVDYNTMPDKEFFQTYADIVSNPTRKGSPQQPVLAKASPEIKAFTGEDEPLVFLHGTNKDFTEFKDAPLAEDFPDMSQPIYDAVGMHVGTPSQANMFARGEKGRVIPVVLQKTRKITDALDELGDELGFDAGIEFFDNPKHMKNGVLTESGMNHITRLFGDNAAYTSKAVAREIRDNLRGRGVNYIPYINKNEDVGDLSVWVLDPKSAKHTGVSAQ